MILIEIILEYILKSKEVIMIQFLIHEHMKLAGNVDVIRKQCDRYENSIL